MLPHNYPFSIWKDHCFLGTWVIWGVLRRRDESHTQQEGCLPASDRKRHGREHRTAWGGTADSTSVVSICRAGQHKRGMLTGGIRGMLLFLYTPSLSEETQPHSQSPTTLSCLEAYSMSLKANWDDHASNNWVKKTCMVWKILHYWHQLTYQLPILGRAHGDVKERSIFGYSSENG